MATRARTQLSAVQSAYARSYAETFSLAFQEVVRTELIDDWPALGVDYSRGEDKRAIVQALGCSVEDDHAVAPTHATLVANYLALLERKNVDLRDAILPAVVMVRGDEENPEFRFITPGHDPWPEDEGFRIYGKNDGFRLPQGVVQEAIAAGRFPLLEAIHDVFHLVAFVQAPGYAAALREWTAKAHDLGSNRADMAQFYAAEWLTLADPAKRESLRGLLMCPAVHDATGPVLHATFAAFFEALPFGELVAHCHRLIRDYGAMLVDYGGGVSRSKEKNDFVDVGITRNLVAPLLQLTSTFDNYSFTHTLAAAPSLLAELLKVRELPAARLDELFQRVQGLGGDFGEFGAGDMPAILEKLIRIMVARMEFGAWESATRVDYRRWMADLLDANVDADAAGIAFVRHTMGENSPLYRALMKPEAA